MSDSKKTGNRLLIGTILISMIMLTGCGTNARQEIDKFRMRFHLVPTSDRETIISDNSPIEDALIQEEYAFEKRIRDTQNSELEDWFGTKIVTIISKSRKSICPGSA